MKTDAPRAVTDIEPSADTHAQEPVAWLEDAMNNAKIPVEFRSPLIGYFCNAYNAALAAAKPTDK